MPPHIAKMSFVSAYTTDTRLMGVVGLYIHWVLTYSGSEEEVDFHQFFYFETEEFGLEEYYSIKGNDMYTISQMENSLFGGLGGVQVDLTEKEARYMIQLFVKYNKENKIPLPAEGKSEYLFLIEPEIVLSAKERKTVMTKMCTEIENEYQAIHYFLMRVFGKDFIGAAFLMKGNMFLHQFEKLPISTLCLNTIDEHYDKDGKLSYLAESVLDCGDYYYITISELTVDESLAVTSFTARSSFKISSMEAAMKLRRPEFMTIYSMSVHPARFETECTNITDRAIGTVYDNGKLYMILNTHNNHVKERVFRLSNDVTGLYYISNYGQLIATAYSLNDIYLLEREVRKSSIGYAFTAIAKYEFKEPLLYEFINSDFDDFDDFLDVIRDDLNEDE